MSDVFWTRRSTVINPARWRRSAGNAAVRTRAIALYEFVLPGDPGTFRAFRRDQSRDRRPSDDEEEGRTAGRLELDEGNRGRCDFRGSRMHPWPEEQRRQARRGSGDDQGVYGPADGAVSANRR